MIAMAPRQARNCANSPEDLELSVRTAGINRYGTEVQVTRKRNTSRQAAPESQFDFYIVLRGECEGRRLNLKT